MKVTEFSNKTKVDNVRPEWEKYLGKEDFISYKPSYVGGTERDKFEKFTFPAEKQVILHIICTIRQKRSYP